ncbi:arm repeat-containing protein [Diplodia corticola]|uniref:Arm repeat-containing protein n=1 Tax=Diplodia corticola TaxID=236234 RepID=A0A1J9S3J0_9PEZI|nr:arm repeat-containing protein [Diplodia corticola]OJD34564.1 arm repeat-containing protein [Diplodia corticola]
MSWEPQQEPLRQLAQCLKDSLSGHDQNAQKNAELMLAQAKRAPDIENYLVCLFTNSQPPAGIDLTPEYYSLARSAAAIMLKNDIKTHYKSIPDDSKAFIRSTILNALQDPSEQMRNYAGNVITEVVRQGGILGWPQILAELISLVSNQSGSVSPETQEGAMGALLKICEDNRRALDREYQGQRPLDFIFPKLLDFTNSQRPKVRANALAAINVFVPDKQTAVVSSLDALLLALFRLASDNSGEVRKHVCRAFVHIAEISPEKIVPHMEGLVDYMVTQQRSVDDPELALDAAEFWLCVGEDDNLRNSLGPYLPKIVPVLLESMVYSEDDILRLEGERDDAEQEDREQDIKPTFASSKANRFTTANGDTPDPDKSVVPKSFGEDDLSDGELEDFDDDDDDEDGLDPEDQWNLRKCSAAALDVLASVFHQPVFEVTLPYLKENLVHAEWPNREAAVLALGAIADGCMDVVQRHLPELTQYLITLLQDKEPVVRQITCWSLGRYSSWAAHLEPAGQRQFFEPMMDGILKRMLDSNKRVQEAAASAFANLEEKANAQLTPYCAVIVQQFVECFARYKDRNMFILYDCVQTLAEHVGPALKAPDLVNLLMPTLIERWNKVSDNSREMFPLLECLSYVATALGDLFAPFAKPIFTRCINIVHQNLEEYFQATANPGLDEPDKDFLVTSLDLLSAIIQSLEEAKSSELVATSQPNMFELLAYCMKDVNNDVRQSAYALLGDCAIYVFPQLQPFLPSILEILTAQLDLDHTVASVEDNGFSVVNNACWSVGEIAMRQREGMAPYVERLLQKLATILFNGKVPMSLNENAAIALGRLGIGNAQALAPHLGTFAPYFINAIKHVDWTDEKGHALNGFINIVLQNPQAMEQCLLDFFAEMASAPSEFLCTPNPDGPAEPFSRALMQYKNMIPDFDAFLHHLPPDKEQALRQTYHL